jgi:mycofactocin glycosyltransferase
LSAAAPSQSLEGAFDPDLKQFKRDIMSSRSLDARPNPSPTIGHPAAYHLRKGVRCWFPPDSKPLLVSDFPLRGLAVQRCWRSLLARLASGDFVSLKALAACVPDLPLEKTEIFLEHLVRKAFCEREGITILSRYPFITIIVPVRNRCDDLARCLDSLSRLDYPADRTEIIVVDDASSDGSLEVAAKFPVQSILLETHRQASFCRNLAARRAKGEILFYHLCAFTSRYYLPPHSAPATRQQHLGVWGQEAPSCLKTWMPSPRRFQRLFS